MFWFVGTGLPDPHSTAVLGLTVAALRRTPLPYSVGFLQGAMLE